LLERGWNETMMGCDAADATLPPETPGEMGGDEAAVRAVLFAAADFNQDNGSL